jgi:hypothetical protein
VTQQFAALKAEQIDNVEEGKYAVQTRVFCPNEIRKNRTHYAVKP